MSFDLSRRSILTSATLSLAAAVPGPVFARSETKAQDSLFGPAPGLAILSRNENPYGPAPSALKAITDTARMGSYYADHANDRLTAMIAERYGLTPDRVMVSAGSAEILSALATVYGRKGNIIVPELFFEPTVAYAERQGTKVIRVPLKADMSIDLDAMAAAVTPETALVQITNPNNPTGMLIDPAALRRFVRLVGPKAAIIIDEAYMELTDRPEESSMVDLVKAGENVFISRTFSKIYGMAGLRVGYALGNPEILRQANGYMMSYFNNTAGLAAAIASLNDTTFLSHSKSLILEGRAMIQDAVKRAGLTCLPSQTNFVYVKVPDADALNTAMAARGVQIRGAYGKWKQWSRVSTGKLEDVRRYAAALPSIMQA
jgi:histidinol-phosphate aminotransferase